MRPATARSLLWLVPLLLLLAACAGGPQSTPSAEVPEGDRSVLTEKGLLVETLVTGLDAPWEVAFAPDGRIFITEHSGEILVLENGEIRDEPYADLPVEEMGEGGLHGLAFDPDFEENGYIYAYYTTKTAVGEPRNRLVRLVEKDGQARQDAYYVEGPAADVNDGGRVAIGPDGKLYATFGDIGDGNLAQDPVLIAGKIVRLERDGTVPEDNPFPGSPIYASGFRNPQGLAWDGAGNLYATDRGPDGRDEVNLVRPGGNYGWPAAWGAGGVPEYTSPILESGTEIWDPSGAAFLEEGPWAGSLVLAGLRGRSLYRVGINPADPVRVVGREEYLKDEYGRLQTVKRGPDGSLYVLTSNRDGPGELAPEDDRLLKVTVPG